MCRKHWSGLCRQVRDAIIAESSHGEGSKRTSVRYLAVYYYALGELAYVMGPGRVVALESFQKGERFRKLAIDQGLGDPCEAFAQVCCAGFPLGEPHPETDISCFHWPADGTYVGFVRKTHGGDRENA